MFVPVTRRNGKCTPGSGCTPNMKSKPYVPDGVRRSPSRLSPGGATPCLPTLAVHGPKAGAQPAPARRYAVSVAVGAPYPVACTTIAWLPVTPASCGTGRGRVVVVVAAAVAAAVVGVVLSLLFVVVVVVVLDGAVDDGTPAASKWARPSPHAD